jgi:hypothetical protein
MSNQPPQVDDCLSTIKDYVRLAPLGANGKPDVFIQDILEIIAQYPDEVEDFLQQTQTPISLDGTTSIFLHYRPKESAND